MSYVSRILQPGEQRLYSGNIHWIGYLPPLAVIVVALVFWLLTLGREPGLLTTILLGIAGVCGVIGVVWLAWMWFDRWNTEIEITDRRIIYKRGFIRRDTREIYMDKVESVDVSQSVLGRILDYGDVTIFGVGTQHEPLRTIAAPLEFRNKVTAR